MAADSHFPIQNLPFGVFSTDADPAPRVGVAIGDQILDLAVLEEAGLLTAALPAAGCSTGRASTPSSRWAKPSGGKRGRRSANCCATTIRACATIRTCAPAPWSRWRRPTLHLPVEIGGYTDFYSSKEHATNVGMMFRDPKNALLPNWLHLPVGYNGRASSVVVSGTPVRRPNGQTKAPNAEAAQLRPVRQAGHRAGDRLHRRRGQRSGRADPGGEAERHIFGMVLMNDWSARDIQQWEYVPLGPFNSKTFATSISPWVVTLDALEPFRVGGPGAGPGAAALSPAGRQGVGRSPP